MDRIERWGRGGIAVAAVTVLGGCGTALLDPRGPVGQAERTILLDSLAIMLAIVVPTIIATLGVAWWYRAAHTKARYLPDWEFSGRIELVVWAIPLMTIILLGGVAWISSHQLDPARPLASRTPAVEIQVVSLDWKWLFIYPEAHVASVNRLVVPAGVPLHLTLTSASVMNTFFVPQLGSMIYTMNGMATQLHLQADEPGTFLGLSGHFSGDGFSDMRFDVRALSSSDYAAWLQSAHQAGRTLDGAAYRALSRQGSPVAPATWGAVEPDLFHQIVMQVLPPGPGPETGREGASGQPAPTSATR
ncbi:MAG: ubiquinol oxidase subunit II [Proteobacteria bacterium]|nr:ubiquinol oxidase subunit II [Pseudomonadota bacterium]